MFVFYDTETTGIDLNTSQIVQIGLLFTDDDLNVLATKKLFCGNDPWALPAPAALLTTGFMPDDLKSCKTTSYEMMREVNDWLQGQHWPLTFVGYNSIEYDEPVLAQNRFQSLLDPNVTTSGNSTNDQCNGRADVMYMVEAAALYMPGALKLDALNYYKLPSMTLKVVAQQNGVNLSDKDAHDALNDIKATVGVAKVIKKAAPQVWEQMMALSTVKGVDDFLKSHAIFTYADADHYDEAAKKPYPMKATVATALGEVAGAGPVSETLCDLRADPSSYVNLSVEQLKDMFLSDAKDKPLKLITKSKQPILMPIDMSDAVLTKEDKPSVYEARAKQLKADKGFMDRVAQAALLARQEQQAKREAGTGVEKTIDRPIDSAVKAKIDVWVKEFHNAEDWKTRAQLVNGFRTRFKDELAADPRLDSYVKLAGRLVYAHAPQELSQEQQHAMKHFIAERLFNPDPNAPYMTLAKARKELSTVEWLRGKPDSTKWKEVTDSQIRCLKLFYTAIEKEYAPYYHGSAAEQPKNDNKASETPVTIRSRKASPKP